jgi:predicted phosphoadenosine phosphosulfate sulfurtransferase
MKHKIYRNETVLSAARTRIKKTFDDFERVFVSFSGGKDSSVMLHLVMEEAQALGRKIGVLVIDFEAQYKRTADHVAEMLELYRDNIEPFWCCLPIKLRNASSNFEPVWTAWDPERKDDWVREMPNHPGVISDPAYFPWFQPNMEFEEFIVLFADWYAGAGLAAGFIGIRADESLNRFRTICTFSKETWKGQRWTTRVTDHAYNIYPIYDWKAKDIWKYHAVYKDKPHNTIYDLMHQAGVPISQQRLCQPYGDDQRRGLWLYHLLEPETWYRVVARVNGVNSGALYIQETGNMTGYNKIVLPEGHTYESFCKLLLRTMPKVTRDHYTTRFKVFLRGWRERGYVNGIPDFAPKVLENAQWAPSYRRLCKVLLRNDWWCKGLGLTQPKSDAYDRYLKIKKAKKQEPAEP